MEFDCQTIVEVFETNDFNQVNRYLEGGWKQIGYSESRDVYILAWVDSNTTPKHFPTSMEVWARALSDQECKQD